MWERQYLNNLTTQCYFFLTERTAPVMKMVITSQLFSELPRRTEQFPHISQLKSQKKNLERKLLLKKVKL